MNNGDNQSRFINTLKTQQSQPTATLPCPFTGHAGRIFANIDQLFDHVKLEHPSEIAGKDPRQARSQLKYSAFKLISDQSSEAAVGDRSTPDIEGLTLESGKDTRQSTPSSGKKRRAEEDPQGRRGKAQSHVEVVDADNVSRRVSYAISSQRTKPKLQDNRLSDSKQITIGAPSPHQPAPEPFDDFSNEAVKNDQLSSLQPQSPARLLPHRNLGKPPSHGLCQRGLVELQRYDSRYPGLLLQPDSRPISQEQLASEVKSIYAGLTMVESKCIQVDRAQAATTQDDVKLASDHWQALIALHRTLLHEHHDFFLASQHPSASPALRRLAAKYSMPARMWKHGIHSFLELLRRRLPDSIDYMLAFIYLAYQMMALLYETVPAFEDTWIECLGDLGRYRMAIEDEDIRDRETWAGVARSWYTKAADKNPTVGRLCHHLAILARPNALQQLYYYSRSLTCVKPFPSARESILTLLDPILGRAIATYSHALPIDTNFIKAHALLFEKLSLDDFKKSKGEFLDNLDNHIGRVTAKWKEQGVYLVVINIAAWFDYGVDDNPLRQVFLTRLLERSKTHPTQNVENIRTASPADQQDPPAPSIAESDIPSKLTSLCLQPTFINAKSITNDTFALVLRRIGDKNVLPAVHIQLSYLSTFACNKYVSSLIDHSPWTELVVFFNTLVKIETQIHSQSQNQVQTQETQDINALLEAAVFPSDGERSDELPLPEDYFVRGLVWAQEYFPLNWFEREHDEEERYLELASTVKSRVERVLRLGYQLTKYHRWILYDRDSHTFSVIDDVVT